MPTAPGAVHALADDVHARLLSHDPLEASMFGLTAYDAQLPDVTVAGGEKVVSDLQALLTQADRLQPADADQAVTLEALRAAALAGITREQVATHEFTLSTFEHGPALLMLVASETHPATARAAADHLDRARGYAAYIDACAERLRGGAAKGRTPVAALLERAGAHLATWLAGGDSDPLSSVPAPPDADADFAAELADVVRHSARPAVARYHALLTDELIYVARPPERCGLSALPGGEEDYDRLVALHTTLPTTARAVHEVGVAALAELGARMSELGARIGIHGLPEVLATMRAENAAADPVEAMAAAQLAVRRAEAAAPAWFTPPLPGPCLVAPMDVGIARAGMAPHYLPPTPDGGRGGTYAFNTELAGAGGGWDLEAVAYHETVPGHHLQIARDLLRTDLPALQRQWAVTAMAEGWGLYAEVLAEEMGLYTSDRTRLGALGAQAFRAARLVVDTGMHAFGWSRERALALLVETVPLPADMLAAEIDRYIAMPGQALAYMTGQRELLRLRAEAAAALGTSFDLRGFHDVVLGHGQVPLPAVGTAVRSWVAAGGPVAG
jgi:uncharacterized protein (DUF885 family)